MQMNMREIMEAVATAQASNLQQVSKAAKSVGKRLNAFGGNCAAFAIALQRVLGTGDLMAADSGGHYEYVDHIALKVGNVYLDGNGLISVEQFQEYATDDDRDEDDEDESSIFEVSPEQAMKLVDSSGGGMTVARSVEEFEAALKAALRPSA